MRGRKKHAGSTAAALAIACTLACQTTPGSDSFRRSVRIGPAPPPTVAQVPYQKGMNYAHIHRRGQGYGSAASYATMQELRALDVEWLAITPFGYMRAVDSTHIAYRRDGTMRDADVRREIRNAHTLGFKVLVKPHIWSSEFWTGTKWRGDIAMESDAGWRAWFASYAAYITHFARIADETGAEAFCVGIEYMRTSTVHENEWRKIVAAVRAEYAGLLTYAANPNEYPRIAWWDALDMIGVNAYFPLSAKASPSVDEMVAGWRPHLNALESFSTQFDRPVIFTELGYRSATGAAREPWKWDDKTNRNDRHQADCYEAFFRATRGKPWFKGAYFWKWHTVAHGEGGQATDFTPEGKPAAHVLKRWFRE